jgi:hypothetical protein
MGVRSSASFATHGAAGLVFPLWSDTSFLWDHMIYNMRRDENLRDIETVLNLHDQLTNTGVVGRLGIDFHVPRFVVLYP